MKKKKIYIGIILLAVIIGGYYWYKKSNTTSTAVQYKTVTAEKGMLTTSISGSGNVIVDNSSTVDPTISGTVTNLAVKVGDSVKKGQLLFVIDNDQLGVSAAKAGASYAQSKESVNSAKYSKKQAEAAYKANPKKINKDNVELAKEQITLAQQNMSVSYADYQRQLADANKRKVISPIDGTVNVVNIKNGDDLSRLSSNSNSSAPIIIGDLNTLKAQVQVNEIDIADVSIDQKVMLKFNAVDGLNVSGKVEKMDSLGTLSSGVVTYNVTIAFDTIDPRIKSGMSVAASIITAVKQDVITVSNSALKSQGGSSYVQILKNGAPEQTRVEIGIANNTDTEIVSGISVGDNIVTQTIDPNAKATTTGSGGGGVRIPGLGGGGR